MRFGGESRVWNINPLVATIDGFCTPAECRALIDLARDRLRRSRISYPDLDGKHVSDVRTSSGCTLRAEEFPAVLPILMKLGMMMRIPITHAEPLSILHYEGADEFRPHHDSFAVAPDGEARARFDRAGGQRLYTTMIYLNDVDAGGATEFDLLGVSIPPAAGRALVFANTHAGTHAPSEQSRHAGRPVDAGEKWVAVTWWHEARFDPDAA